MSQLEVDKVIPQSGTTLTLGESGDTITIPSGATFSATLTAPVIDEINDNNGNEEIIFTTTASAVNELTIANAATGNAPEIAATGSDTNIDLKITPKGTGKINLDGIKFPNADGSAGQFLQTNGSGVLSFAGGGKVLQVVQTNKTDTFTTSSTSFTDVTGLSVSITPSSASNKILITFQINGSQDVGVNRTSLKMLRDSTVINAGAVAGSRSPALGGFSSDNNTIPSAPVSGIFLDSPATTSSITYKIQIGCLAGNGTAFINRTDDDGDEAGQIRMASNLVAIEIAG